ncbi:hypothetical protein [Asinibacterium sp. OR53]|jgi:hypothetical protein|uniref:hypothetical protein n=1 Tax=Asinibacterium sp. OR53 TaxID=925409 RepID=UPI000410BE15|nr:hypothetical protein [Asinibacterium sp. OR53]
MSRNHVAGCPNCGERISFKRFVQLYNFSATNCGHCNARIEISNRTGNTIIAAVSGILSGVSVVYGAYLGQRLFDSLILGLFAGIAIGALLITVICKIIYRRSRLLGRTPSQRISEAARAA